MHCRAPRASPRWSWPGRSQPPVDVDVDGDGDDDWDEDGDDDDDDDGDAANNIHAEGDTATAKEQQQHEPKVSTAKKINRRRPVEVAWWLLRSVGGGATKRSLRRRLEPHAKNVAGV